jgi:hypothetical protein
MTALPPCRDNLLCDPSDVSLTLSLTKSSVGFTENGALAVSLHGMTSVIRKDLQGLPPTTAAVWSRIDDDDETYGQLIGS